MAEAAREYMTREYILHSLATCHKAQVRTRPAHPHMSVVSPLKERPRELSLREKHRLETLRRADEGELASRFRTEIRPIKRAFLEVNFGTAGITNGSEPLRTFQSHFLASSKSTSWARVEMSRDNPAQQRHLQQTGSQLQQVESLIVV